MRCGHPDKSFSLPKGTEGEALGGRAQLDKIQGFLQVLSSSSASGVSSLPGLDQEGGGSWLLGDLRKTLTMNMDRAEPGKASVAFSRGLTFSKRGS